MRFYEDPTALDNWSEFAETYLVAGAAWMTADAIPIAGLAVASPS